MQCLSGTIRCHIYGILILIPSFLILVLSLMQYDDEVVHSFAWNDVFFEIVKPEALSYTYRMRPAKDFGVPFNQTFSWTEIPLVPVHPPYCCNWPDNAEELKDSIALVERGECSFLSKAVRAEELGAKAIIISDNDAESDDYYIEMVDDNTLREVHIPAAFLLGKNGYMIRRTLQKLDLPHAIINIPVNLTFVPMHKINQPPWLSW